jgi:hypothetical protein
MAVIAKDGYFPAFLAKRINHIPVPAIIAMSSLAFCLVLAGNLELILEFGSVTFLLVSLMMTYANYKIRINTNSSAILTIMALSVLSACTVLIIYFEITTQINQMIFIGCLYALLTLSSWLFSRNRKYRLNN